MARDITNNTLIENPQMLIDYLRGGERGSKRFRIGVEHEVIPFFTKDKSCVPYFGEASIKTILEKMQQIFGWEPILDNGNIIGLVSDDGAAISIEPAGQLELSEAPLENILIIDNRLQKYLSILKNIVEPMGIKFLAAGAQPLHNRETVQWMPKSRYEIMRRYMPKVGNHGLDMMSMTATIQVNLDFSSEADMRNKMQIGMKLQPLATALFAASPFREGQLSSFLSWRAAIWRDTDPDRTGLLDFVWREDFGYIDYINWALACPMYFIVRDGKYIDCTHMKFGQFMENGYGEHRANMGDFINHLSTLFPEVRLKRYIEMRGSDSGCHHMITALPAFWVGLLYSENAMQAVQEFTKGWDFTIVSELLKNVSRDGLKTPLKDSNLGEAGKVILEIAEQGLKDRGFEEEKFLRPLQNIIQSGKTHAEIMIDKYKTSWAGSIEPIYSEYSLLDK